MQIPLGVPIQGRAWTAKMSRAISMDIPEFRAELSPSKPAVAHDVEARLAKVVAPWVTGHSRNTIAGIVKLSCG